MQKLRSGVADAAAAGLQLAVGAAEGGGVGPIRGVAGGGGVEAGVVNVGGKGGDEGVEIGGVCGVGSVIAAEAAVVLSCCRGREVAENEKKKKPFFTTHDLPMLCFLS